MPYARRLFDLADWFRQLWAESLGKRRSADGRDVFVGQTPVRSLGATDQHSQSQLYVEYRTKTYGEPAIAKLLVAYRDGKDTAEALKEACGADKATFEKGYRAYVEEVVKPYRSKPKSEE